MLHGSTDSVIASIREEAAAEVERIEKALAAEVERLHVEGLTFDVTIGDREQRLAAARRRNAERLAQEEWDARRAAIEQREAWIARVVARGREIVANDEVRDALVEEARAHLPQGAHTVTRAAGGGCLVSSGDTVFDNSYEARARRFEPEWRRALSEVYRA